MEKSFLHISFQKFFRSGEDAVFMNNVLDFPLVTSYDKYELHYFKIFKIEDFKNILRIKFLIFP